MIPSPPPTQLRDLPIVLPVLLTGVYVATMFALGLLFPGWFAMLIGIPFSFQFWTYAVWRGLWSDYREAVEREQQ